jgi:hypothetical protein
VDGGLKAAGSSYLHDVSLRDRIANHIKEFWKSRSPRQARGVDAGTCRQNQRYRPAMAACRLVRQPSEENETRSRFLSAYMRGSPYWPTGALYFSCAERPGSRNEETKSEIALHDAYVSKNFDEFEED